VNTIASETAWHRGATNNRPASPPTTSTPRLTTRPHGTGQAKRSAADPPGGPGRSFCPSSSPTLGTETAVLGRCAILGRNRGPGAGATPTDCAGGPAVRGGRTFGITSSLTIGRADAFFQCFR